MRGTNCADPRIEAFSTVETLPPAALTLLSEATSLFGSATWWHVVLGHALPPKAEARFVVIRSLGQVIALVPMLRNGDRLSSLTTPYTCDYTPLFADGLDQQERIAAMAALARFGRGGGTVRFDALPAEWDDLEALEAGSRQAGLVPLRFDHFGNWYERTEGHDWAAYLARRSGALRETVRRRLRRAEKLPGARFDLFTRTEDVDKAVEAFEAVYHRSWKDTEPYPTFNAALIRATAALGQLRLGVWSIGSEPVAVQFWVIRNGEAIVLKLAHDEAFKAHSPGTVLTALMLRHLLDNERIGRIDFGRGDDAYKQGWAAQRRQRIGMLLVNPWRLDGAVTLLRHMAGRLRAGFGVKAKAGKAGL